MTDFASTRGLQDTIRRLGDKVKSVDSRWRVTLTVAPPTTSTPRIAARRAGLQFEQLNRHLRCRLFDLP
jgi:hypothetical protein